MIANTSTSNGMQVLDRAVYWIGSIVQNRIKSFFSEKQFSENGTLSTPDFLSVRHPLSNFILENKLNIDEQAILTLGLLPHLSSNFLDSLIQNNLPQPGEFPQIGGVRGKQYRGFIPTGETTLFLLAPDDFTRRFAIQQIFGEDHLFAKKRILWLEDTPEGEPKMSGKIILSPEYVDLFTLGKVSRPRFSLRFPAQMIETAMNWEDLVLNNDTMQQIRELESYLKHGNTLLYKWGMQKKLKPGFRVLFHGPPGTGKTLTASLLGKYTGKDAYKIDLSMVVSKYIGETEKNLANLFAKAENKDWILFFDEADALFGKRTNVRDAHDKYANQEVSYLLQRVENYNGLVILATNFLSNIDDAFKRRFQSIIHFPFPEAGERLLLWKKAFPSVVSFTPDVNFSTIAQKYELSGAEIMNIVQYCCLKALDRGDQKISSQDILDGIRREYKKEGKVLG